MWSLFLKKINTRGQIILALVILYPIDINSLIRNHLIVLCLYFLVKPKKGDQYKNATTNDNGIAVDLFGCQQYGLNPNTPIDATFTTCGP